MQSYFKMQTKGVGSWPRRAPRVLEQQGYYGSPSIAQQGTHRLIGAKNRIQGSRLVVVSSYTETCTHTRNGLSTGGPFCIIL